MKISSAIMAAVVSVTAVSISDPAQALFFKNTTGLSSPTQTITFNEFTVPNGTPITNQYSSLGVSFSGLVYRSGVNFPNVTGNVLTNATTNTITNPFSIKFNTSQNQAAFALRSGATPSTVFTALLGGAVVDTSGNVSTGSNTDNFYGFSGITFDEIRVAIGANGQAGIDNIQTRASAPVPFEFSSSFSLCIVGGLYAGKRLVKSLKKA